MANKFYHYFGSYAHPFYRDMVLHPPTRYEDVPSDPSVTGTSALRHVAGSKGPRWSGLALRAARLLGYPKIVSVPIPEGCVFVHAAQYLLKNKEPWVTDFEDATAYAWYDHHTIRKPWTRHMIKRALDRDACKAVLPWTKAAQQSLLATIPHGRWVEKMEVLYPCIDARRFNVPRRKTKKIVDLLFVGGGFYEKGGVETIEAFKRLRKKHDVRLTMVSKYDKETRAKYGAEPGLRLLSGVPQEELDQIYAQADIFVMPTHYDTFGLVYLEAMARGLPCVGTTQFAVPEIVQHGKTGLLVKNHVSRFDASFTPIRSMNPYGNELLARTKHPPEWAIAELTETLARLVEDKPLRVRLGKNGRKEVERGRFSVAAYKKATAHIYGKATREQKAFTS